MNSEYVTVAYSSEYLVEEAARLREEADRLLEQAAEQDERRRAERETHELEVSKPDPSALTLEAIRHLTEEVSKLSAAVRGLKDHYVPTPWRWPYPPVPDIQPYLGYPPPYITCSDHT